MREERKGTTIHVWQIWSLTNKYTTVDMSDHFTSFKKQNNKETNPHASHHITYVHEDHLKVIRNNMYLCTLPRPLRLRLSSGKEEGSVSATNAVQPNQYIHTTEPRMQEVLPVLTIPPHPCILRFILKQGWWFSRLNRTTQSESQMCQCQSQSQSPFLFHRRRPSRNATGHFRDRGFRIRRRGVR